MRDWSPYECKILFCRRQVRRHYMYLVNINLFHSQLATLRFNPIKTAVPDITGGGSREVEEKGISLIGCWTKVAGMLTGET